jgi:hypothetical protein
MTQSFFVNSSTIGVDLNNMSATALFAVGTHTFGANDSEWVYVQAQTTISALSWVAFNGTFSAGMASAADVAVNGLSIALANATISASSYGWVAIRGVNLSALFTGTGSLALTSGQLQLASSAGPTGVVMLGLSEPRAARWLVFLCRRRPALRLRVSARVHLTCAWSTCTGRSRRAGNGNSLGYFESEVQEAQAAGKILPLVRLALDMQSAVTETEMHTNFFATLERGFKSFVHISGSTLDRARFSVQGLPSRKRTRRLSGTLFSVNSAIWFLLEKGIVPKYHMIWDAFEVCEKFAIPHPDVTYLVASRCHPKVFEKLKDCNVVVWHAGGDHNIIDVMSRADVQEKMGGLQPLINGGSAGVTRGIFVASSLGYNDIHIFGGDSSYADDGSTHVMGSVVKEKDVMISLGRWHSRGAAMWFRTTPNGASRSMNTESCTRCTSLAVLPI